MRTYGSPNEHLVGFLSAEEPASGGRVYVLEANPNPQLAYGEDFAESAEHGGMSYEQLLQKILNNGLSWRAERLG